MKKNAMLVACLATFFAVSCDKKNETPDIISGKGEILIEATVVNTDQSGSGYIQLLDDISPKTVNNKNAFPVGPSIPPFVHKNWIFTFPNFFGSDVSELTKFVREDGVLKKSATMPLPGNSQATHLTVVNDSKAYLGLTGLGKIFIFNPTTMVKTGEIDLNTYGDPNPEPSGMIVRDNLLFVTLGQWTAGTWFPQEKAVEVLIINTQTDAIEKHIKETASGLSFPTNPGDRILMDEHKNIYLVCIGAFGQVDGFGGGFLRIKAGETDIDPTFSMKFDDITVADAPGKISYFLPARYIKNNITYGYVAIKEYTPDQQMSPLAVMYAPVKVDLSSKQVTLIKGIPVANGYSTGMGIYKNNTFLFGSINQTSKGFYTYDLSTGKVSTEPIIKVEGFPKFFYWFGE
ncbi:hypothetical protein CKY20_00360 [Capnocytophaga canis]|uniref:Lipoprotein n=1 Tax=Capnocytophaga canis TaxID=1848903 RepID=A0A3A1YKP3_9FLAO|nr:hypothetical protein [Capnocytophaga canis]RIY38036.1 hypothetical protein CKY20_00360 [Capnocytophaga canis]